MKLVVQSPDGPIYESSTVFEALDAQLLEYSKTIEGGIMYMHSTDENTHHFKEVWSRRYFTLTIKK